MISMLSNQENNITHKVVTNYFDLAAKSCLLLLAPAMVITVTPAEVLFWLTIFFTLLSGKLSEKIKLISENPLTWVVLLFFSLFLFGAIYSTANLSDSLIAIRKYSKYLLALTFIPLFQEKRWRNYGINSFLVGVLLLLLCSYLNQYNYFYYLEPSRFLYLLITKNPGKIFESLKISMVFNFLLVFAAYLFFLKCFSHKKLYPRLIFITLATFLIYMALFQSIGRTVYFILPALIYLIAVAKFKRQGFIFTTIGLLIIYSLALNFSPIFKSRTNQVVDDVKTYQTDYHTSTGERMRFIENGIKIIKAHPFFGTGSGSFFKEYNQLEPKNNFTHPHNEYIYIGIQFGIVGLIVLLLFFLIPFWYSRLLPETERFIAQGIIISVMIGSLANCWLLDVTVRFCYAYLITLAFAALPPTKPLKIFMKKSTLASS